MSTNKRTMNREELEIHQALSPASGSHMVSGEDNKQETSSQAALSIDELTNLIKNATKMGVEEGLSKVPKSTSKNINKRPRSSSPALHKDSIDSDLPHYGSGDAHEKTVPSLEVFGPDVNVVKDLEEDSEDNSDVEGVDLTSSPIDRSSPHGWHKIARNLKRNYTL